MSVAAKLAKKPQAWANRRPRHAGPGRRHLVWLRNALVAPGRSTRRRVGSPMARCPAGRHRIRVAQRHHHGIVADPSPAHHGMGTRDTGRGHRRRGRNSSCAYRSVSTGGISGTRPRWPSLRSRHCCPAPGSRPGNGAWAAGSRSLSQARAWRSRAGPHAPRCRSSSSAPGPCSAWARALWLGDPMAIPLHQMGSGALLVFAFFMISDPMTQPWDRRARALWIVAVAILGFTLQHSWIVTAGPLWGLVLMAPLVPLLDRLCPAPRKTWINSTLHRQGAIA